MASPFACLSLSVELYLPAKLIPQTELTNYSVDAAAAQSLLRSNVNGIRKLGATANANDGGRVRGEGVKGRRGNVKSSPWCNFLIAHSK